MKKLPKIIWLHVALTVLVLVAYFVMDIINEQHLATMLIGVSTLSFDLSSAIKMRLWRAPYFIIALLPLLGALVWIYRKPKKKFAIRFLAPLGGAVIIPALIYLYFWIMDDRWGGLFTVEVFVVCIFAYVLNELAILIFRRK